MLTFLRRQWFILGLFAALALGFAVSGFGRAVNPGGVTADIVIILIFLSTGFTLPAEAIRRGVTNYRLHLYIQAFIFLVVPAYVVGTLELLGKPFGPLVTTGLYAVAVLPTTITSCTVFTQVSGGNVVATMFNAALANILGIIISPLLLSLLLRGSGAALPPEELLGILGGLGWRMILPILVGHLLRRLRPMFAHRHGGRFRKAQSALILFIVFFTVSNAAANQTFLDNLPRMGLPFLYLAISHWLLLALVFSGSLAFGFPRGDRISALFAAPQKTVALGAPLLTVYFADRPELLAMAILPLVFHHIFQLSTAGVLRGTVFRNAHAEEAA